MTAGRIIATTAATTLLAVAVAVAVAASAAAVDGVPVVAQVNQLIGTSQSCEGGLCRLEGGGPGGANPMSRVDFRIAMVQDSNVRPCNPLRRPDHLHPRDTSITLADARTVSQNTTATETRAHACSRPGARCALGAGDTAQPDPAAKQINPKEL